MPESKSSDLSRGAEPKSPRELSPFYVLLGIIAMALGAGLFHPGAGLILLGIALTAIGLLGAPRRT